MDISYKELKSLLNRFSDTNNGLVFDNDIVYLSATAVCKYLYLKYNYLPHYYNNQSYITTPLYVDFDAQSIENETMEVHRILDIMETCIEFGMFPKQEVSVINDACQRINSLYNRSKSIFYNTGFTIAIKTNDYFDIDNPTNGLNCIKDKIQVFCNSNDLIKTDGNRVYQNDFNKVIIAKSLDSQYADELSKALSDIGISLEYYNKDFLDYLTAKIKAERDDYYSQLSATHNGFDFDDSVLEPYRDFAFNYDMYDMAYNAVCEWVSNNGGYDNRYLIKGDVCTIPCVAELFGWVTLTTGTAFLFANDLDIAYTNFLNYFMCGKELPADIVMRINNIQPRVDKHIYVASALLKHNNNPYNAMVAITDTNRVVRKFKGVPLDLIEKELIHDNDIVNHGIYAGPPTFMNYKTVLCDGNLNLLTQPESALDYFLNKFIQTRKDLYEELCVNGLGCTTRLIDFLKPGNIALLDEYLYSLEVIFSHYMGFDKFYVLSNMFIGTCQVMKRDENNEWVVDESAPAKKYLCTLESDFTYTVHPIMFINNEPFVDSESIEINSIIPLKFLFDYQNIETENGYSWGKVSDDIVRTVDIATRVLYPKKLNKISSSQLRLETKSEHSNAFDPENVLDYVYPVFSTNAVVYDESNGGSFIQDNSLKDDLYFYIKSYILNSAKVLRNSAIKNAPQVVSYVNFSTFLDNITEDIEYNVLKEYIICSLTDNTNVQMRNTKLPKLFNNQLLSYKGLRFVGYNETPLNWAGAWYTSMVNVPPAIRKKWVL